VSYCEILDVIRISGISNQIINESVGTGDGSIKDFSLDNDNVIDDSETIYLNGTEKTRDTHYTINNDNGTISFMSPPGQSVLVTAKYKYFPDTVDLTNNDITDFIAQADAEIDNWTGKKFTDSNSATEYFSGRAEKIQATDSVPEGQYFSETEEDKYVLMLTNYPVQTITSLTFLKDDGTTDDTLVENTDFQFWDYGKIQLITSSIPTGRGKKKVKVVYTHGYSTVPVIVKRLSAIMATIMAFVNITGGSFEDITSYTLGPKSVNVGDHSIKITKTIETLEKMKAQLLNEIGREFRMVVI
jgi:hypothetical protein